jgi:hypothetical protein
LQRFCNGWGSVNRSVNGSMTGRDLLDQDERIKKADPKQLEAAQNQLIGELCRSYFPRDAAIKRSPLG